MRNIKRQNIISIALTAEEFAAVDQASRNEGISPAEFMLQRAVEAPTPTFTMVDYITLREAEDATASPHRPAAIVAAAQAVRISLEQGRTDWRALLDAFRGHLEGTRPRADDPRRIEPCKHFYGPVPLPHWHPHNHHVTAAPMAASTN